MIRSRGESGAGTVLALSFLGLLTFVGVAVAGVVGVVAAHRAAQGAADLAALAGATTLQDGGDPCDRARSIAARNGARLAGCVVDDWEVRVSVRASGPRLLGRVTWMPARARAGPTSSLPPQRG